MTFDTYIKNTKDWLVQAPVLATAGTQGPVINGGDVKNKGVVMPKRLISKITSSSCFETMATAIDGGVIRGRLRVSV